MSSPKHSLFVFRLKGYRAPHSHHFCRPPTAPRPLRPVVFDGSPQRPRRAFREKRLRLHAAALCGVVRPRRCCGVPAVQRRRGGRQDQQWPGPQSGKHVPEIESLELGAFLKNVLGLEILRKHVCIFGKCLGEAWLSTPKKYKKVWINDHNARC